MKPGTHVTLPDGRKGTVVYHGLTGYGIKWGHLNLSEQDIEGILSGDGNTMRGGLSGMPLGFDLEPEAMLRAPWPGAEIECVGGEFEVMPAHDIKRD